MFYMNAAIAQQEDPYAHYWEGLNAGENLIEGNRPLSAWQKYKAGL